VRRVMLIAQLETRLLLASAFPFLLLMALPIAGIAFLAPGQAQGPGHAVPALSASCAMLGMGVVGLAFFRDHGWNTWARLRSSPVTYVEVVIGKLLPLAVLFVFQQVVLLVAGWACFGMPLNGDVSAAMPLIFATVAVEVSLGMLIVALCRTIEQFTALCYLVVLFFIGFGGGLSPLSRLPAWMENVALVSPVYWTQRGLGVVVLGDRSFGVLIEAVGVLGLIAAAGGAIALWRYSLDGEKNYFVH
jgi:ABC-2 type transport system permease protein